ncbi:MAG: hypothetical protein RXP92_02690 [Candidatus Micrarchaeota archaeon]
MHFIISIPLDKDLASFIGKKGSENSITFYNRLYGENVVVALAPSSIDDKPYGLAQSMLMSSQIVISTASIDRYFGEVLVAAGLLEKRVIFTNDNEIGNLAKSAGIAAYEIYAKEELLDKIVEFKPKQELVDSKEKRVDIDRAFVVRGVGTVVLGIVSKGSVAVHDTLYASSGKQAFVRSIQSQDRDIDLAPLYTRVGLAIKGIEAEEIEKGEIFASNAITSKDRILAKLKVSSIVEGELKEGSSYGLAVNFSFTSCFVEKIEGNTAELKLDKPLPFEKGDEFFLIRQKQPRLFAKGVVL